MASRRLVKIVRPTLTAASPPFHIDYRVGWAYQTLLLHRAMLHKRAGGHRDRHVADHLMLLEQKPVYTLGRGSDLEHLTSLHLSEEMKECLIGRGDNTARLGAPRSNPQLLNDLVHSIAREEMSLSNAVDVLLANIKATPVVAPANHVPIYRVERGGEVTYHGPGQIVGYPLLDLVHYRQDLHWFLRQMEQVIIDTLRHDFGLQNADRDDEHTGVWIGDRKIAAIGIAASRWITSHGFSINVSSDLRYFDAIRPCGIEGRGVTSLAKELGASDVSVELVTKHLLGHFARIFNVDLQEYEER